MPSSQLLQGSTNRPLHQVSYQSESYREAEVLISMYSPAAMYAEACGYFTAALASTTYPASNRALGFMFCLADSFTVQKVWWGNGTTATTNAADVGVYTEAGTTLLVSGGSTNIATANVIQEKDVTDTVLAGGARYWCVYCQNGTTATPLATTQSGLGTLQCYGVAQFAGAVPLGSTFTPATVASGVFPFFGIAGRTQVA